jgi:ubiquitin-conjugating enzyme E2 D/E
MSNKRLEKELLEMNSKDSFENCSAELKNNNIFEWEGIINGPVESIYEGGIFKLNIIFPVDYPFKPPKIEFITKIYHPNISEKGEICLDILKNEWSPALTIRKVLLSLSSLLVDPNPYDPLSPNVASEYLENKEKFNENAKKWVKLYA